MKKHVVILGAGFGGLATAVHLCEHASCERDVRVTIVDEQALHTYTPLLYEVASGGLRACIRRNVMSLGAAIRLSYEGMLVDHPFVSFVQARVTNVDLQKRYVEFASRKALSYDVLVCALGARVNTFGVPGVWENGFPLKSIDDALKIHDRVCALLEQARNNHRETVRVVVAGAGPTGVETAAEIASAFRAAKKLGAIPCDASVVLVDASERILSMLPASIAQKASRRLRALGVDVYLGTTVKEVGIESALVAPNRALKKRVSPFQKAAAIEADVVVWTGGVAADPNWRAWGMPTNAKGYVCVDATLRVKGQPRVFAVGDMVEVDGKRRIQVAAEAVSQGMVAAQNVLRVLEGEKHLRLHKERMWPWAIPLGGRSAIAHVAGLTV
ncbi:FAD-dependent oxidoreductase, partial [Candidatus Uhrbacteria bacterium]|nr:FAD-dependent oxidoreductase [Candidatus Uhrbacteria bacterium]